jgi:hypothetical protein
MQAISVLALQHSSQLSAIWPSISQMLVTVDVCPSVQAAKAHAARAIGYREGGGGGAGEGGARGVPSDGHMLHAKLLADLQAHFDAENMLPYASTRQVRLPRSPPLSPALLPAGFPDLICAYRLSLARRSRVAGAPP